jgi:predicted nuclease with TOPRIM domain
MRLKSIESIRQLQLNNGELLARVDNLVAENRRLAEKLRQSTAESDSLRRQISELEGDIAGVRTALRRMIREQTTDLSSTWSE